MLDVFNLYENKKTEIENIDLDFLTDEYMEKCCSIFNAPNGTLSSLIEILKRIKDNPRAEVYIKTYIYYYYNDHNVWKSSPITSMPSELIENLGRDYALSYIMVLMYNINNLQNYYIEKSINECILRDTLSDVGTWMNNYTERLGSLGISEMHWLYNHITGKLFKLGRLQFMKIEFKGNVKLLKQDVTTLPLILSDGDIKYDFLGNKVENNEDFVSTYMESDITITGNPLSPDGKCQRDVVTLNKCDYTVEIQNGDTLLDIHIPGGCPLEIGEVVSSIMDAIKFFYKHFNGEIIRGFTCESWLLNPSFKYVVKGCSNIKTFSSMFYLYPLISNDREMFKRVFHGEHNLKKLKEIKNPTSLQRDIIRGLDEGYTFEDYGMIYPSYDIRKLAKYITL